MAREKLDKNGVFFIVTLSFLLLLSGADCLAESYYPLEEGMVWEYQVARKALGMREAVGGRTYKVTIKALAPRRLNDKKVVPMQYGNGDVIFVVEDEKGVGNYAGKRISDTEPKIIQPTNYLLKYPLKVGVSEQRKWKTALLDQNVDIDVTMTIETLTDIVKVPAGTFQNCLRIKRSGKKTEKIEFPIESPAIVEVEVFDWFTKNIGWIKQIRTEKTNNLTLGLGQQVITQLTKFTK